MPSPKALGALAAAALLAMAGSAHADPVATSLPYPGTPDWTDIVFGGTSMVNNGSSTTLSTNPYRGVWFGWGSAYGDQPAWSPGSPTDGNYLSLTASFSADAVDWSAYFYDQSYGAAFQFNPTDCSASYCYDQPHRQGVEFYFGDPLNPGQSLSQFVALDLTAVHSYEFLLKGGQVTYRVDGHAYSGDAIAAITNPVLVIGDGSGSTGTGLGSMTVHGVGFDNRPSFSALPTINAVPEPATWAIMTLGMGMIGGALRSRTRRLATA